MAPESQTREPTQIYIYIYLLMLHITTIKLLKHHDLYGCPFQRFGIKKEGRKPPAIPPWYFLDSGLNSRSQ